MKDQLNQITEFLKVTHKVEGFMKRNQTCYLIQIKPEYNVDIRDIKIPKTTNCGSWSFLWVATEGTFKQGKLMAIPKWRKAKSFLNKVLINKLKSFGFNDLEALVLARVIKHKSFERDKLELIKGIIDNPELYKKLVETFELNKPNVFKYELIESYNIKRPKDFNTLLKTMQELKSYFNIKGANFD